MGKYGTARRTIHENTIRRMRLACWITKDTDTHAEYVVLIVLARQQCLCEHSSALRHTYMARVVYLHLYSDICWQPWFRAVSTTDYLVCQYHRLSVSTTVYQ